MIRVSGTDGSSVLLEADMAKRVAYVVLKMAEQGLPLHLTEGYRPVGVPADRYITEESKTSTGGSNQWFQKGREDRGETPSAAVPGTSRHGAGRAVDWSTEHMVSRAFFMAQAGLVRNIPTESWHAEPLNTPTVDLDQKAGFLMALSEAQQKAMFDALLAGGGAWAWPEAIVGVIRKEVIPLINDVRAGRILFPGAPYYMAHAIVNTVRAEGGKELTPEDIGKLVQTNVKQAIREALTESGMNMRTAQAEEIIGTLTARLAPPEQADSVDAIAELEASIARVDAAAALPIEDAVIVEDKPAS
ncbi:D-alanyl-D-alanine carboxypeptidase family protein [Pseudoclavibacter helvolus]|uniref:D-alanyl-D-alanine carboxypeptidase-like protein n=1 Tax=Pseudoclavibacter helvolus TaxID=255205 RepID=A0A7W4URY1_9MICO|nr:D-alanyl-D-alanine carboxypeptidase family protein [Pseudoclavibacter helvolus]MBB2959515.1 hypothetical protein [Pseudoclavibacter helvolus]